MAQAWSKTLTWKELEGDPLLPLVVSYFTDDFYMRDAFELARSCQAHKLSYLIMQVPDKKSWLENTNYKPTFLAELAACYPKRDLLWLDADARVRATPNLFYNMQATLAYFTTPPPLNVACSGTVYLGHTDGNRARFLSEWCKQVKRDWDATDQVNMRRAEQELGMRHLALPVEYCWIYDLDPVTGQQQIQPGPIGKPVIEHMQSSRIVKQIARLEKRSRGVVS